MSDPWKPFEPAKAKPPVQVVRQKVPGPSREDAAEKLARAAAAALKGKRRRGK